MVNPSTANALKDRAQRASISLKQWAKRLETQLNERRLPPDAWRRRRVPEIVALQGKDLENLLFDLNKHAQELANFSK
jgi:hypothetical protein